NCLDTIRLLLLLIHPPPSSTLFPYTTLFRSELGRESEILQVLDARGPLRRDLGPGRTVEGGVDLDQVQVGGQVADRVETPLLAGDRKSTRLNSSHVKISYAVFCLKKKKTKSK